MGKLKPETRLKRLEKQVERARTIFICMDFMSIVTPDTMKDAVQKFLKETEA